MQPIVGSRWKWNSHDSVFVITDISEETVGYQYVDPHAGYGTTNGPFHRATSYVLAHATPETPVVPVVF